MSPKNHREMNPVSVEKELSTMRTWCLKCQMMRDTLIPASSYTLKSWMKITNSSGNDQMCIVDTLSQIAGMTEWRLVSTVCISGWKKSLCHHIAAKSTQIIALKKHAQQPLPNLDCKHLKLHLSQNTEVWSHWNPTSKTQLLKSMQEWLMQCVSTQRSWLQTNQQKRKITKLRCSGESPSKKSSGRETALSHLT